MPLENNERKSSKKYNIFCSYQRFFIIVKYRPVAT